jgi:GIY-YIG catalytic domain-containing protein
MDDVQQFRDNQLKLLTDEKGVYALCDLEGVPIYVGKSTDGIRTRVRRHLTSARSDVIANRLIDVWEVAFVWGWPADNNDEIAALEHDLFFKLNGKSPLMNSQVPRNANSQKICVPVKDVVQILADEEIASRLLPRNRFSRQSQQVSFLLDYILEIKSNSQMQRSLRVHFDRLAKYHEEYQAGVLPE